MIKPWVPALFLAAACSTGSSDDSPGSFSASFTGNDNADVDDDTGDGDPDPTGDPTTTGDGDPDPTTTSGDGDPDPTTSGDGDGDEDPCELICNGKLQSNPNTCDKPHVIGRTQAKAGFFHGGSTQAATNEDYATCGPQDDPANWDSGPDHFFRIYLVHGDSISAVQNPSNWKAKLKIHDEATCIGSAKACSTEDDPATISNYVAPKTDWFTLVVDGQSVAFNDWGDYTLTVNLSEGSNVDECGCP
jgi:hypothetical protein